MDYIIYSIPVFLVLILIEIGWSAWSGKNVYRFNDLISNIGCGIGSQVVGAFTKTAIFAIYLWTYDHWRLFTIENSALTWIVAFLLVDLLYYWFHRLSHEVNFLWAAHIVHHQSEEYNLSVALRQSWWQGVFSWWFYLPMALLGIHPLVIVTVGAFNTLYQFWIHTKAISHLGPLEFILNTPAHHRVHHGSDPKYIDRNHAGTLIIWDKLFGTFQEEEEEPTYGITDQLGTWDPVTANFHYWRDLGKLAGQCTNTYDKVRVFLKPPGWRPEELGGFQGPKKKDHAIYKKFDTITERSMTIYVLVQFVFLLAVTSFFLFQQHDLDAWQQWAFSGLIVLWVMDLGLLLEGSRIATWLEIIRITALALILISCSTMLPDRVAYISIGAMVLISLTLLGAGVRNRPQEVADH